MPVKTILNSAPPEAWVALIGVVIGSGFTLLGSWFVQRSSIKQLKIQLEHEKLIRKETLMSEKKEELYILSKKYFGSLVTFYLPYKRVMKGELTYNQALDLTIERGGKNDFDPHRVSMLIDLYFPELQSLFNEIIEIRDSSNKILDDHKHQYKQGDAHGKKYFSLLQPKLEFLVKRMEDFDNQILNV